MTTYKVKWTTVKGEPSEQMCFTKRELNELLRKLWLKELTYRIVTLSEDKVNSKESEVKSVSRVPTNG